jgi:hypothetical protein
MESIDIEIEYKFFQDNLNALPNFYRSSNGNLDYLLEQTKNDFFNLNSEEISDILLVLDELNKAIQINIDENYIDDCSEIVSILRKPMGQTYQKSINKKKAKKNIFKPLKKPKKIFLKVLKDTSFLKDTQNTQNFNSKKTAADTSLKSNNNIINVTEKVSYEANK